MECHQPPLTRRFFKTMITGFHRKLSLPPAICKKLHPGNKVILESSLGKWEIGVCKYRKNNLVFDARACEKEFGVEAEEEVPEVAPYFARKMVPGYAAERAKLNIPTEFVRSNNLGRQKRVCLRDPRGRTWMVTLELANNGLRQRMSFYESNGLKDEDTCIITLIRPKTTSSTIVFEITILRAA